MSVNIKATFKKDTRPLNGLEAIEELLVDKPLDRHVIVAVVETVRITDDVADGGTKTPTVRLVHIEPMTSEADEKAARKLLDRAHKARGGTPPAPDLFSNPEGQGEGDD